MNVHQMSQNLNMFLSTGWGAARLGCLVHLSYTPPTASLHHTALNFQSEYSSFFLSYSPYFVPVLPFLYPEVNGALKL